MRYIKVQYLVEDDEYDRLVNITNEYKKQGLDSDFTPEKLFDSIMCLGAKDDKDRKLKFHEWKCGIRENFN